MVSTSQVLLLAVTDQHAARFGGSSQHIFAGRDGSIGRSEDCDWVLSASGVSRVHAMIRCLNGIYFIEDRSTNGMLLNGRPLIKGDPAALKEGDRLQIDTFEVSVSLRSAADAAALQADAAPAPAPASAPQTWPATNDPNDPLDFGLSDLLPRGPAPGAGLPGDSLIPDSGAAPADLDPLSFLDVPAAGAGPGLIPETPVIPAESDWNHSSGLEDHFRPPATVGQHPVDALPEDWDLGLDDFSAPPRPASPEPAVPVAPAAIPASAAPMAAPAAQPSVAAGGLSPELERILQIVVDGVMDVLRARAEIKNSFRLPVTVIQRSENNPLKFAATTDEALQKILAPTNTAFLSGSDAFHDAFEDIRCHQMAMLAGVRAAFESLLTHFTPDRFEHEVDGGRRSAFGGGKGKYWDKYREDFEGLMKDPDECFRRLFGDEFASAYEEQLGRLKSARRANQQR